MLSHSSATPMSMSKSKKLLQITNDIYTAGKKSYKRVSLEQLGTVCQSATHLCNFNTQENDWSVLCCRLFKRQVDKTQSVGVYI